MAEFLLLHVVVKFIPVVQAFLRRPVDREFAQIFDEASGFTHVRKRLKG
jgi:hypothetical protein